MEAVTPTPPPAVAAEQRRQQALAYGLISAAAGLCLLVCGLRLYVRKFVLKLFGVDDIAVTVALVLVQVFNGLGIGVVYFGSGKHINYVPAADLAVWVKLYYAAMCMYLYVAMSVKISLLIFLRRLFPKVWLQRLSLGLIIFLVVFTVSGSLVLALQCSPARAAFDLTITQKTCISRFTLFQITLYQAVFMFAVDIIILVVPIPILLKLKMPGHKIVALIAIFGSGIIACIAPVVRFSTLDYLLEGSQDLTFDATSSLYWMTIEFNLGLVAGSLSSLRPLGIFRRFGSTFSRNKGSTGNTPYDPDSMEMGKMGPSGGNSRGSRKHRGMGMGTTILQSTINESQEHIIYQGKEMAVSAMDKASVDSRSR